MVILITSQKSVSVKKIMTSTANVVFELVQILEKSPCILFQIHYLLSTTPLASVCIKDEEARGGNNTNIFYEVFI